MIAWKCRIQGNLGFIHRVCCGKNKGVQGCDVASLTNFFQNSCGIPPEEKQLSVSGKNWGELDINGNMLSFLVGGKQAFEVSLADVSQTQLQGKNDVILEFHEDDTTGANEKDSLMEMSFHIPNSNTQFIGDENHPPSQSNQPHTFVVVTLDPPIRKGQTLYPHIVMQFETDYVVESTLMMNDDLYAAKYKDKLEPSYKGLIHEVFTIILRCLSSTKLTRPGKFRSCQDGYAVKSSLKAEDGVLYPLEKSFFFLPKPPTLILHDEIDYVEFERHAAGGSNMHYFDLLIRLKTEQEHLFLNIQRNEYHNLYNFISSKGLKIMNLGGGVQAIDGVAAALRDEEDDAVDPHLERIKNEAGGEESDEEDEDFVAEKDDEGSPTDDSGGDDSDGSDSGDEEERITKKESKKEAAASKTSSSKKKNNNDDGSKKRKQKKKKDPNAPKRAMSGFMFFSQLERENVKKEIPGISFKEMGRVLGERWNKLTA
ncbi:hypothetical protein L1987_34446 [Smallanthus sonchifolius]|uniref:Uncharacterized protein n=1 Tax=Smallanthus sonchifolius TaxID=185202 RepID=A0ACB9HV34_9ASTR|nr:hypothetical protein L1987_34446 [Smallanthus sonchifolius]